MASLVVCALTAGCGGEGTPEAGVRSGAGGGEGEGSWRLGGLELVGPVRTIEAFEDAADGYFADLVLAEPLEAGGLLTVDRMLPAVLLFDGAGEVLSRKGRQGAGPGELSGETPSASASDSSVWVVDHRNGRLQPFRAPGRPPFLPGATGPGCVSESGLWVSGVHSGRLLHLLDPDGQPVRSIGDSFGGPDAPGPVAEFVSRGPMVCTSDGDVLVASYPLGAVRSYRSDGSLAWEAELPDFVRMQVAANDRGGVTLTAPEGRGGERLVEDLVATLWTGGDVVGVQFGDATQLRTSWRDLFRLRTVLLDRATGEVLVEGDGFPRIDRLHGDFAISYGNVPLPGVRMYRWSWRSSAPG